MALANDFGLPRKRLWYSGIQSSDSSHTKRRSEGWRSTFRTAASVRSVKYPLVGTYPVDSAYDVLTQLAKRSGESSFTAPKGGFAVYSTERPTNIYLAYPGSDVQIEVFDPSAERARELVASGHVVPVG